MALKNLLKKLHAVEVFDVKSEIVKIINNNKEYLLFLLKDQMSKGKDKFDRPVTIFGKDFYSELTISIKEEHAVGLGALTAWVTNYFTGYFYSSLQVITTENGFYFTSDAPYFKDLLDQSGSKAFTLNERNIYLFKKNILLPQLRQAYKSQSNGL